MKRQILAFIIGGAITLALFGGSRAPVQPIAAEAQSANPRGDLVTRVRQTVNKVNTGFDEFVAERAEYVGASITFTSADLTGSNITSPSTFTFGDMNQVMTDFNTIITNARNGGTTSVGVWANVLKVR